MYKLLIFAKNKLIRIIFLGVSFMTGFLILLVGGTIGFFTAALCRAAGRADEMEDRMEAKFIPSLMMETSEEITPEKPEDKNKQ
jgi:hypothetical protein